MRFIYIQLTFYGTFIGANEISEHLSRIRFDEIIIC